MIPNLKLSMICKPTTKIKGLRQDTGRLCINTRGMDSTYELNSCQRQLQAFHNSYQPIIETYAIQQAIHPSFIYHTCVIDDRYRTECLLARLSIILYIWQFDVLKSSKMKHLEIV